MSPLLVYHFPLCRPLLRLVAPVALFVPAAASQAMGMVATYTIMVNDSRPIWLYCAQAKHCQNGMTMVINEK